jgi:hypothetical protein
MKTSIRLRLLSILSVAVPLAASPIAAHAVPHGYSHGRHGRWHHPGPVYGDGGGGAVAGALLGLGVGALIGGALAQSYAPPPPVYYAPPPPVAYAPPPVTYYAQ